MNMSLLAPPRGGPLSKALLALERIAPLRLAAAWDNVGLLVDSSDAVVPSRSPAASYRVFLTNDLTPAVLSEAVAAKSNLIVSYHPTPFQALKKFDATSNHAARVVLTCAAHGIAVYSPHTAFDSVVGGVNDWLVDSVVGALPPGGQRSDWEVAPIRPAADVQLAALGAGDGRRATLVRAPGARAPPSLRDFVEAVKAALGLDHVTLALPSVAPSGQRLVCGDGRAASRALSLAAGVSIRSFAVCAGSGASILSGLEADVLLSGEMGHHEVLAAVNAGCAVVLTGHSNCERGALAVLERRLGELWMGADSVDAELPLEIFVSTVDADPLVVV